MDRTSRDAGLPFHDPRVPKLAPRSPPRVRPKNQGYQPPDPQRADQYDHYANQPPVEFDDATQRELLLLAHAICNEEQWRLEASGFDPTHAHFVISWVKFFKWERVDQRLKNLLALNMNRNRGTPGKRWFVRGRSAPRRVKDEAHFQYLIATYLPDHPGLFWVRGTDLPE